MKLSFIPLIALALASTSVKALPKPAPSVEPNSGTILVDCAEYRACPRLSCPVIGQYAKGTHIDIVCHTVDDTTPVNGDPAWARLTNGYWVSLQYVSWDGTIPFCPKI